MLDEKKALLQSLYTKIINQIKNTYENKNKLFTAVVIMLLTVLMMALFVKTGIMPKTYNDRDFVSNMVKTPEKTISDRPDSRGIFTYGPYINLQKGDYKLTFYYKTDEAQVFDLTYEKGGSKLFNGSLEADKTQQTFDLKVPKDITDKSVEIRTYYNGRGTFTLNKVTLEPVAKSIVPLLFIICFVLSMVLCAFLFKAGKKLKLAAILYTALHYFIFYPTVSDNLILIGLTFIMSTIMIFAVYFALPIISDKVSKMEKLPEIVCTLLSSYLIVSALTVFINPISFSEITFAQNVDFENLLLEIAVIFNLLIFSRVLFLNKHFTYVITELSAIFLGFEFITHITERNIYFTLGVVAIIGFITYYLCKNNRLDIEAVKIDDTLALTVIGFAFLFFVSYFSMVMVCRYRGFNCPTFDFGIFAQMFENMAKTGIQNTTVERNQLLSHFAVHCSPIYYILLPFYFVFRSPETLLVAQVVLVGLAVFPVFFLCKHKSDNNIIAIIISICYLATPAMICPMYYDIHETCFMPVLLLSMLYFIETKKWKWVYIFAFLTLLVKEDSALYLVSIALYLIAGKKEYKRGILLALVAVIYFSFAYSIVNSSGQDVVANRYGIYCLPGEEGTSPMFKNIIRDPGFLLQTMFHEDMVTFVLYTIGVFAFIPLMGRKFSNLFLLLPFLFMHLATNYVYQHDIGYQYAFGPCALVMFLFIINVYKYPKRTVYALAITSLVACMFSTYTYKGNLSYYINYYNSNAQIFIETDALLKQIPDDATVVCNTFVTAHMPNVEEMYNYPHDDGELPDYYVMQPAMVGDYDSFVKDAKANGYRMVGRTNIVEIFARADAKPIS